MNCGAPWSQTFGFDPFGNISKSGSNSFQASYSTATNRITSISNFVPSYDFNGNLTNDGSHTYSWDADGHAVGIDSVTVTYDALGRMVEQNKGGTYYQIVYSPTGGKLAIMYGQTVSKRFVPLPGGATAVYTAAGLDYYRHADWLGSSRLASTPSRGLYSDTAYAPFGEAYSQSGTSDLSFTGQNQDTVAGLYDFMFREYHPTSGRWISPDPAGLAVVDLANPQSLNRYAYVRNNPVNHTDPTGLFDDCTTGCDFFSRMMGAWNQSVNLSFDRWADYNARDTAGKDYYNLPGHANPAQQGLNSYTSWVDAIWQAGGSTITWRNGVSVSLNWTIDSGVYGFNLANGETLEAGALAEAIAFGSVIGSSDTSGNPIRPFRLPLPNVPPGAACNKYPPGALRTVCNQEPNSPTNNCVRGYLLQSYDPSTGSYKGGIRQAHCNAFAACGMSRSNPAQIAFGCYLY